MNEIEVSNQEYELLVEFSVEGQPPRKSNQRRIVTRGRGKEASPMLIKSQEALNYVEFFGYQVPAKYKNKRYGSLSENLRLDVIVWYRDRRPDLSIELIKDCLESAGIISNDRYVREEHLYGFVDKKKPRSSIRIYRIFPDRKPPF